VDAGRAHPRPRHGLLVGARSFHGWNVVPHRGRSECAPFAPGLSRWRRRGAGL